jgi:hypothetical protein
MNRAESLQERIDALKRKCSTGYGCGSTCISLRKECRTRPGSAIGKERLKRLMALAAGGPSNQRGIGTVKAGEAGEMAQELRSARGSKAQELLNRRKTARQTIAATAAEAADRRKAKISIKSTDPPRSGSGRPRKDQLQREFTVEISGGNTETRTIHAGVFGQITNVRLRDPDASYVWSTSIHRRAAELGKEVGVNPLVVPGDEDAPGVPKIVATDLNFFTGTSEVMTGLKRIDISPADGALVARAVFRQMAEMLKGMPDGSLLTCSAYGGDGYGEERKKMYEALGFQFPVGQRHDGIALVKGGKIAKRRRMDSELDDDERLFIEAAMQLPEFGGGDRTTLDSLQVRIDALKQRFDARRRQEAPGQMALDLTGGGASGGRGPGGGEPCGAGWIDPRDTCRKGAAAVQPAATPNRLMQLHQETQARKVREAAERKARNAATAAAGKGEITLEADGGEPRFRGQPPVRSLGSGAFGKTYQFDTADGPVVVKVNSLTMGDPAEDDPRVGLAEQRENVARRELRNLQRAHAVGLGPKPIGDVVHLPDGRWSLAYRMLRGSKLTPSHQTVDLTPEAAATLSDPKAAARYVAGALQLARRQADSGLIHGDLHGGNILVGPDGTPALIDWGQVRESPNPWNEGTRSAAMKASDEGYALIPLLSLAGQAQRLPAAAKGLSEIVATARERARDAELAFKRVISAHDLAWEETNEDQVGVKFEPGEFRRRIVEANRIKREEGMPYDMALRDPRVGLEPPLTPEVLARAAAARDAIFGQSDLDRMRRELDRRFGGRP